MTAKGRNETPNTPDVTESRIARTKVDELPRVDRGVRGTADLMRPDLVKPPLAESRSGGKLSNFFQPETPDE